jgi:lipopolysaccharide heptosyltransferase II
VSLLKILNPDARITWLVNKSLAAIAAYHPDVDEIIHFDREGLGSAAKFIPSLNRLRKSLKDKRYRYIFDFQGLLRNSLTALLAASGTIVGFEKPRERLSRFFYDKKIAIPKENLHAVERNCALVRGVFPSEERIPPFSFLRDDKNKSKAFNILKQSGVKNFSDIVIMSPCARWKSKMWPSDFFAKITAKLASDFPSFEFVLIGSEGDKEFCGEIRKKSGIEKIHNLAGLTSLPELVEVIRLARAMLCVDSGPMHIAAALGVPVFAVFGPTDPAKTGPFGKQTYIFQPKNGCIKCFKRYCSHPINSERCHYKIPHEDIIETFKEKIRE